MLTRLVEVELLHFKLSSSHVDLGTGTFHDTLDSRAKVLKIYALGRIWNLQPDFGSSHDVELTIDHADG